MNWGQKSVILAFIVLLYLLSSCKTEFMTHDQLVSGNLTYDLDTSSPSSDDIEKMMDSFVKANEGTLNIDYSFDDHEHHSDLNDFNQSTATKTKQLLMDMIQSKMGILTIKYQIPSNLNPSGTEMTTVVHSNGVSHDQIRQSISNANPKSKVEVTSISSSSSSEHTPVVHSVNDKLNTTKPTDTHIVSSNGSDHAKLIASIQKLNQKHKELSTTTVPSSDTLHKDLSSSTNNKSNIKKSTV